MLHPALPLWVTADLRLPPQEWASGGGGFVESGVWQCVRGADYLLFRRSRGARR